LDKNASELVKKDQHLNLIQAELFRTYIYKLNYIDKSNFK